MALFLFFSSCLPLSQNVFVDKVVILSCAIVFLGLFLIT